MESVVSESVDQRVVRLNRASSGESWLRVKKVELINSYHDLDMWRAYGTVMHYPEKNSKQFNMCDLIADGNSLSEAVKKLEDRFEYLKKNGAWGDSSAG